MSTAASARSRNRTGGSPTGREALTGPQLNMVIKAAHTALTASEIDVSPSKVNRIVRRFSKHLVRSRMTFGVFLDNRANQRWMPGDPLVALTISYLDPTGEKAARNVDRQRRWQRTTGVDAPDGAST